MPVEYRERLDRWSNADKGEREVRLCTCESIEVPVAVGLFDSMILIPKHLLDSLSQSEIDQIILHELAHLRRADDWTNGLQRFVQALFFFNPAVMYIAQQLDLEREVACDDWVIDQTKEVRPYAACLTKMAEATVWPHRPLAAPGVFLTRRGLSVRVERLLRSGRNARIGVSFGPAGAIAAALIVLFFLLQTVAPSFAFTLPQEVQPVKTVAQASAPVSPHPVRAATRAAHSVVPARHIDIPARHIDVPARHIDIPARHIDVPAQHIDIPALHVNTPAQHFFVHARHIEIPAVPYMPDIARGVSKAVSASVSASVSQSVAQAMALAAGGKGGHYNCVGCDYSGQNLSGRSFRGQRLSGADFSNADLHNADFSNSVLVGVDFSNSDLRGANFSNAKMTGCDLSNAKVDGVNFNDVSMVGCDVNARALAPGQASALLHGCRTGCDFGSADLRGQDLRNIALTGVDLSHADLRGADLSGVKFRGVDLSNARLDGARVNGAEFSECDFSGVNMHAVDFSNAKVTNGSMDSSEP